MLELILHSFPLIPFGRHSEGKQHEAEAADYNANCIVVTSHGI